MWDKIDKLIKKNGLTDYGLAKRCGIPPTNIYDWKSGRCKPKFESIEKIADYFDISMDYFRSKN